MLHPSYTDLMKVVNSEVEPGETPVVNSRYSIVMATAKRARQIIGGQAAVTPEQAAKPLSTAVAELNAGKIKIMPELSEEELEELRLKEEQAAVKSNGAETEELAEEDSTEEMEAEENTEAADSQDQESGVETQEL